MPALLAVCLLVVGQLTVDHDTAPALVMPCEAQQFIENPDLTSPPYGIEGDHMGRALALGHWDDDGVLDLAVGGFKRIDTGATLPSPCCGTGPCQNGGTTRVWIFLGVGDGTFATTPVVEWRGNDQRDLFGGALEFIPDVDGDGLDDLLVGAANWPNDPIKDVNDCTTGFIRRGRVYLFGSDGTYGPIGLAENCATMVFESRVRGARLGAAFTASDSFDGDALTDLFLGAPGSPDSVATYSGRTHVLLGTDLQTLTQYDDCSTATPSVIVEIDPAFAPPLSSTGNEDRFGEGVANLGDLDGDGDDEIFVGATQWVAREVNNYPDCSMPIPGEPCEEQVAVGAGFARIYTWASGAVPLLPFDLPTSLGGGQFVPGGTPGLGHGEAFGYAAAGRTDVDGDGVFDVCVGAPAWSDGALDRVGRVRVYSGAALAAAVTEADVANAELYQVTGDNDRSMYGNAVEPVGDLFTGDGRDEFAIGAYQDDLCGEDGGVLPCPEVPCLDANYTLPDGTVRPWQGMNQSGSVYVVQTVDVSGGGHRGAERLRFVGEAKRDHMGFDIAVGLLTPSDSTPDVVVSGMAWSLAGTSIYPMSEPGRVYVFHGEEYPMANRWGGLGHSLDGTDGRLLAWGTGEFAQGADFLIGLENALPNANAALVVGFSTVYLPAYGGVLVPSPDVSFGFNTGTTGNLNEIYTWPGAVSSGSEVVFQWWVEDAGAPMGWATTAGVEMLEP